MKKYPLSAEVLLPFAQALSLTASVLISLLSRLNLTLPPAFLAAILISPLALYAFLFPFRRLRFLLYPLSLLAILAALLFAYPDLRALFYDPARLSDPPAALAPLLCPMSFVISVLLSVSVLTVGETSRLPLGIAAALLSALLSPEAGIRQMLLPGFSLALSACPSGRGARRALPAAALSFFVAAALCFSPLASFESPRLREFSASLLSALRERLFYSEARTPFSLSVFGWEPLGAGHPGGSAFPSETPVLKVRADAPLLLRGTIHSEYDGQTLCREAGIF